MHVVINSPLNLGLALGHWFLHSLSINEENKRKQKNDDSDGRKAVTPYIDTFIVNHEQTLQYFFGGIKIDSIPMSDVKIILHKVRCCLIITDIVMLLIWTLAYFNWLLLSRPFLISWLLRRHCRNNKFINQETYINKLKIWMKRV